jgi:hypothetical protein
MNVLLYGAGMWGERILKKLSFPISPVLQATSDFAVAWQEEQVYKVLAVVDSNPKAPFICGNIKVIKPEEIHYYQYDKIIISSATGFYDIQENLIHKYQIPKEKIDTDLFRHHLVTREIFLYYQSQIIYNKGLMGNVAEAGVFRGDFAKFINLFFPDRILYLFDTFEGHDSADMDIDITKGGKLAQSFESGLFKNTSEDFVKSVLPYPDKAIIKKGYFPETAEGIRDEFVFVSLDLNLYAPILAGLEFFYPKLVRGGIILVHDYFDAYITGVSQAVNEFCKRNHLSCIAIGDELSVAIMKN